jgi:transcription elongation factor Elf1
MMLKLQLPYAFTVICPHCGNVNRLTTSKTDYTQIVECDIEDSPGCGKYFVVKARIEVIITDVYTLTPVEVK